MISVDGNTLTVKAITLEVESSDRIDNAKDAVFALYMYSLNWSFLTAVYQH